MPSAHDDQLSATKSDIRTVQRQMETMLTFMGTFATKEDLEHYPTTEEFKREIEQGEGHVMVQCENLRHDVLGAIKDLRSNDALVANHGERLRRVEQHLQLAA